MTSMHLNDEEQDILAGKSGPVPQQALRHQIIVGEFFGANDFVPVTQAHIMADTESLGEAGVRWLERLAAATEGQRRVRVPTITDPRGTDFAKAAFLGHTAIMLDLERRAIAAFVELGVLMTDTCINYQTIQAPTRNEHCAFGDTGVVIYSNSVCGARSNFEGGPSALAAGLTGRTPRYGFHLPEQRRGTLHIRTDFTPASLNEWGALGGVIGRIAGNYWAVPVIEGIEGAPRSDQMKHFGAAMASFGSSALFQLVGHTPEAGELADVAPAGLPSHPVTKSDIQAFQESYRKDDRVDVVVFSAPQLSLYELRDLAELCRAASGSDESANKAGLRPDGLHRADRRCWRDGSVGHVFLSVLRPGNSRGKRLEVTCYQQRQVGQYPRWLWLPANAGFDGSLR